MMIGNQTSEDY